MKLYIPPYLRTGKIPVLKQLYEMVASYSEEYTDKEELDSFNDYKASLINDPVLLFLDYCVPNLEDMKIKYPLEENLEELRKNHINYLTTLFYSVKGTYKVLDYLTEYDLFQTSNGLSELLPDETTTITYTTQSINIEIQSLPQNLDRDLFCAYLEKFLCTLLYFETLTITINSIGTKFNDNTVVSINHGEAFYQYFVAIEEEDNENNV